MLQLNNVSFVYQRLIYINVVCVNYLCAKDIKPYIKIYVVTVIPLKWNTGKNLEEYLRQQEKSRKENSYSGNRWKKNYLKRIILWGSDRKLERPNVISV